MTPEQRKLLEDKIRVWREESKWGNMDLRDYNRRCADALEAAIYATPKSSEGDLLDEAVAALRNLAGNAGAMRAFEYEIRAASGNTNWQCLMDAVARADAVLAKAGKAQS